MLNSEPILYEWQRKLYPPWGVELWFYEGTIPQDIISQIKTKFPNRELPDGKYIPGIDPRGDGVIRGMIAEYMFHEFIPDAQHVDAHPAYDYIWRGYKIDIKSRGRNWDASKPSSPSLTWNLTIPIRKWYADTDIYIWSFVSFCLKKIWYCGVISNKRFRNICVEKPPKYRTGNRISYNEFNYEILVRQLSDLDDLWKLKQK